MARSHLGLRWIHRAPGAVVVGITLLIVLGMLYFGLRLKGYQPENGVLWLPAGGGLWFDSSALAYTEDFLKGPVGSAEQSTGLTIEILLYVAEMDKASFRYILSVHGGSDQRQLLIGQWRRWLMVMNGDDYDGKQGVPKIYLELPSERQGPVWLSVVADARGTAVYLEGRPMKSDANLHLTYPRADGRVRLVLGNSVYGKHGWRGAIRGVALYARALDAPRVRAHFDRWAADGAFEMDRTATPEVFYEFGTPGGNRVQNEAGECCQLQVPAMMTVLQQEYLQWPRFRSESRWHMLVDGGLNLAGFVPLGFMLVILLWRLGWGARACWVAAMGAACLLSLSMEMVQAWIPSRDSSLLDWVLNSLGAGTGAWAGLNRLLKNFP